MLYLQARGPDGYVTKLYSLNMRAAELKPLRAVTWT